MSFTKEKFNDDFRKSFLELGDALSRATLIQALGAYTILKLEQTQKFVVNKFVITRSKPIPVVDDDEIIKAITALTDEENSFVNELEDGSTVTTYYVIEKQKPDWRAAQALWEHELGKATQKAEVSIDAKISLADLLS